MALEQAEELLLVHAGWAGGDETGPALAAQFAGDLRLRDRHPRHLALLHPPKELGVVDVLRLGDQGDLEQIEDQDTEQHVAQREPPPAAIAAAGEVEALPAA